MDAENINDWEESTNVGPSTDPSGESNAVEASLDPDAAPARPAPTREDPRAASRSRRTTIEPPAEPPARTRVAADTEGDDEAEEQDDTNPNEPRDARGRFRQRKRAASQVAGPEDVPRIRELTRQIRERDRELERVRQAPPRESAAPARPAAEARVEPAAARPPEAARPKFDKPRPVRPTLTSVQQGMASSSDEEIYAAYEKKLEEYDVATDTWRDEKAGFERDVERRAEAIHVEEVRIRAALQEKFDEARKIYPDFNKVALEAPTRIKEGSVIDAWILEHKNGGLVLYALQEDPALLDRLAKLKPFDVVEELSLLGQRLRKGVSVDGSDAPTGSSRRTDSRPQTRRPLNPVRTGVVTRASDEAPNDNATLEEHEKHFGSHPRRFRSSR